MQAKPSLHTNALLFVLFADIVSYSRMMGENEEETLKILEDFNSISIPIVNEFKGKLINRSLFKGFIECL